MLLTHWLICTQAGERLEPEDIRDALDKDKTLRISRGPVDTAERAINKLLVEWYKDYHKRW